MLIYKKIQVEWFQITTNKKPLVSIIIYDKIVCYNLSTEYNYYTKCLPR